MPPIEGTHWKSTIGGVGGVFGGFWTPLGSRSMAMINETPSAGRSVAFVWIGMPGTIVGGGSVTFDSCTPTAEAPPLDVENGRACHPGGRTMLHPAGA